jgi:hypothetical protein
MIKSFIIFLAALVLLNGCSTRLVDDFLQEDPYDINRRLDALEGFQTSADVIAASRYHKRIDNYPITVFVFSELDAYLEEQGMTKQTLLDSPKLDGFVRSTMLSEYRINWVSNASQTQTQQLQTLAGDAFTTSNYKILRDYTVVTDVTDKFPVDAFTFDVDAQEVTCVLHAKRNPTVTAFLCRTTRPFVEFDW